MRAALVAPDRFPNPYAHVPSGGWVWVRRTRPELSVQLPADRRRVESGSRPGMAGRSTRTCRATVGSWRSVGRTRRPLIRWE